jgi:hypothetical protein
LSASRPDGDASDNSYNDNKTRFLPPIPVDARVRGRAEVVSIDEKGSGWWKVVTRFTLRAEDNEKPCFAGDSVTRVMACWLSCDPFRPTGGEEVQIPLRQPRLPRTQACLLSDWQGPILIDSDLYIWSRWQIVEAG